MKGCHFDTLLIGVAIQGSKNSVIGNEKHRYG